MKKTLREIKMADQQRELDSRLTKETEGCCNTNHHKQNRVKIKTAQSEQKI